MSIRSYSGSNEFRPLSPWAYVGYAILFSIPLIGFLFLIIFSFNRGNINRRSFARSYWCWLLIAVIVSATLFITGFIGFRFLNIDSDEIFGKVRTLVSDIVEIVKPGSDESTSPSKPQTEKRTLFNIPLDGEIENQSTPRPTEKPKSSLPTFGVSPAIKEALDSYEVFFDKYIAFMKKYQTSANTASMLLDYADYMAQYADMMQKLEEIEKMDLSAADEAYYIKVSASIMKKLAGAVEAD